MSAKSTRPLVIRRLSVMSFCVSSASVGLFLARVVLEVTFRPLSRALVVGVGLAAALVGAGLGRRAASRSRSSTVECWPALVLLVYVLWPRRDLFAAASVAVLVALLWLFSRERLLPWTHDQPERTYYQCPRTQRNLRLRVRKRVPPQGPLRWRGTGKGTDPLWADGATFVVALVIYVATAAPDVLPADFGEFQLVAALLGVAHPFGFPLYTLVGHLFIRLFPWGTPAYRLNLMSGLLAAGTLVLVARATRLWARRLGAPARLAIAGGLAAALALGTATTFWAQATIANVRTPAVFLAALGLYALARFSAAGERVEADRALILLGLALGLGGGHYPPLAFVSLFFIIYVLLVDPRLVVQPRRWWRPLVIGLLGFLLPLAYLPIRGAMDAPLAPEGLDTLPGFLHHFLALGFGGDMFAFANAADLPHRLSLVPTLFLFQFNLPLLLASLLGLVLLIRYDWRLFVLLVGSLILHTFVSITYRAPQTVEYLMPAYLPVAIAVGLLPSLVCSWTPALLNPTNSAAFLRTHVSVLLCALVLWAGLLNGWSHAISFVQLARDRTARQTVAPLLEQAPVDALILADWRWATPLWYLQQVEGVRPDVEVRYVYPVAEEEYWETWLRHVQEEQKDHPQRSVLLTHYYNFTDYTTEPWESGFLIRPRPVTEPMAPLRSVDSTFGDRVQVVGYSLQQQPFHSSSKGTIPMVLRPSSRGAIPMTHSPPSKGTIPMVHHPSSKGTIPMVLHPGQVAEFVLAWRPTGPLDPPPSFTVRLMNAQSEYVAQADRALSPDVAPGEVRFARLTLPLYPTLSPGQYTVSLGAYTVTDAGFENLSTGTGEAAITLTDLELVPRDCNSPSPFTLHRQSVPFAAGPTLVGVDYDRSVPDVLRIYLNFRGAGQGTWQARVRTSDGLEVVAPVPFIPAGTCHTIGVDLKLSSPEAPMPSLKLSMALQTPPRRAQSSLTGEQEQTKVAGGAWGWPVHEVRLPTPAPDARFVPLGDEMVVVGFEARRSRQSRSAHPPEAPFRWRSDAAEDTVAVDVTLVALRPLTSDDATSVRLMDADGRWLARHDMQPALSAVPTLKWIRGSRVVDRHVLTLPEDSSGTEVKATLVAYERFRMTSLPPMDGRFSEVPLGTWTLP